MRFAHPEILWLLLAMPPLALAAWISASRKRRVGLRSRHLWRTQSMSAGIS